MEDTGNIITSALKIVPKFNGTNIFSENSKMSVMLSLSNTGIFDSLNEASEPSSRYSEANEAAQQTSPDKANSIRRWK